MANQIPEKLQKAIAEGTITKIYSGKDNACRCGCSGKYYTRNDKAFHRIYNLAIKSILAGNPIEENPGYINIPRDNNKAYTIYFE